MTISRRIANLVHAFLTDEDVATEYGFPQFDAAFRLMDDGLEIVRPSIVVSVKERERSGSRRYQLELTIFELVAMRPQDAPQPTSAQVDPDDVSNHLAAFINAIRYGFAPWLAARPEADRSGYVVTKIVVDGQLNTSRDGEARTVDYAVQAIIHAYCLT